MDGFIGTIYMLADPNPDWLTVTSNVWNADIIGVVPTNDMSEIAGLFGDFEFTEKESGSHFDTLGNKIVDKVKVTGKAMIGVDAASIDDLIASYQGIEGSIAVISEDLAQGEYIGNVITNFTQVGKIGELIKMEMTIEYDAAKNTPEANSKRRIFKMIEPVA